MYAIRVPESFKRNERDTYRRLMGAHNASVERHAYMRQEEPLPSGRVRIGRDDVALMNGA
jgi:hypothetical protein